MKPEIGRAHSFSTSPIEQEFQLLSMTELRNGPGEILDRVAEKGEAFIIERSGQRRACLVPLSLFFPDIPPARIADELKELEDRAESPRATITPARELALRFTCPVAQATSLELTIVLPHRYPNRCPRVYAASLEAGVPHRWADGALCLFGVMGVWNPGKHTAYTALVLARRWLKHYTAWRETGHWPESGSANE